MLELAFLSEVVAPITDPSDEAQEDSVAFRVRQFAHEGKIFVISSCAIADEQNIAFCSDTQEVKENLVVRTVAAGVPSSALRGSTLRAHCMRGKGY